MHIQFRAPPPALMQRQTMDPNGQAAKAAPQAVPSAGCEAGQVPKPPPAPPVPVAPPDPPAPAVVLLVPAPAVVVACVPPVVTLAAPVVPPPEPPDVVLPGVEL